MFKASIKSLLGHKARLFMSIIAIILGTAFVAGSFTFTDMLRRSFGSILSSAVADIDVSQSSGWGSENQTKNDSGEAEPVKPLTETDLARFREVPGVSQVEGTITGMGTYPIDKDGKAIVSYGAPGIGSKYFDAKAFKGQTGIYIVSGNPPTSDDEVMIDPSAFDKSGYNLGDKIKIATPSETVEKILVGTAKWGVGGTSGAVYTFFTENEARKIFMPNQSEGFTSAWIVTDQHTDISQIQTEITNICPPGYEVVNGSEFSTKMMTEIEKGLGFLTTFFLVFAGISLLVAAFLIFNTFSIIVSQQEKELALYRALGAAKLQVQLSVLVEALVIAIIGSALGLMCGLGLAAGISKIVANLGYDLGTSLPRFTPAAVVASFGVGIILTMFSAWVPANRASKVDPIIAMTGQSETVNKNLKWRTIIGLTMAGVGVVLFVSGCLSLSNNILLIGLGSVLILLAAATISPLLGSPIIWLLGKIFQKVFGQVGKMAELNTLRQPTRTAATATALMIGMALVGTLSIVGASAKASAKTIFEDSISADIVLYGVNNTFIPANIFQEVSNLPEVSAVRRIQRDYAIVNKNPVLVGAQDEVNFGKSFGLKIDQGRVFQDATTEIVVDKEFAENQSLDVGDKVSIALLSGTSQEMLQIVGLFSAPEGLNTEAIYISVDTLHHMGVPDRNAMILIDVPSKSLVNQVKEQISALIEDYPLAIVNTKTEFMDQQMSGIDGMLTLIYALLALAVVIAVLGIVNTLTLSVYERTSEIGLLRAVGMTRGDIRKMVTLESVAIATLGAVIGLSLGILFGFGIQQATYSDGLQKLVIPYETLLIALAGSIIVGVVAAVGPARRAAKTDILAAISTE